MPVFRVGWGAGPDSFWRVEENKAKLFLGDGDGGSGDVGGDSSGPLSWQSHHPRHPHTLTTTPTTPAHPPMKAHLGQTHTRRPFLRYKTLLLSVAHSC